MTADGNGGSDLDPEKIAELRRLARSRPRSGHQAVAKASALRTLKRFNRAKRQLPPMPDGWYPHEPNHPFYESDLGVPARHPRSSSAIGGAWRAGSVSAWLLLRSPTAASSSCDIAYSRNALRVRSPGAPDHRTTFALAPLVSARVRRAASARASRSSTRSSAD